MMADETAPRASRAADERRAEEAEEEMAAVIAEVAPSPGRTAEDAEVDARQRQAERRSAPVARHAGAAEPG